MIMGGNDNGEGVGTESPDEQTGLLKRIPEGQDHKEEETVSTWCLPRMAKQVKNNCTGCWRDTKRSCASSCTDERKETLDRCCEANYKCLCMCCLYTDESILGRMCPNAELEHEEQRMRAREQRMGSCVGGACCMNIIWLAIMAAP